MIINETGTYTLKYTATDDCGKTSTVDRELIVNEAWGSITWADASDEDIVKMVQAADEGKINLADYWHVGDERVVHLSAMEAMSPLDDTHAEQDVTLVLMNVGGKTLNTPTEGGRTECSFIIGQKNSLNEKGVIDPSGVNNGGWDACPRRTWCNSVYYDAIPSTLRPIFKQVKNATANGGSGATATVESIDYFALPAEREVIGYNQYSDETYEGGLSQFEHYQTSANRIKQVNGSNSEWFERSAYKETSGSWCLIAYSGNAYYGYVNAPKRGLAPFGAI